MPTTVEITDIHIAERTRSGSQEIFSGVIAVEIAAPFGSFAFDVEFTEAQSIDKARVRALYQVRDWTKEMADAAQNAVP